MDTLTFRLLQTHTPDYEQMIALRLNVLLQPIGIPHTYINPEKETGDVLIGAYKENVLVGCCVLTPLDSATVQLRQMAVDAAQQQKGIGAAILSFAENQARSRNFATLMMHARDTVIPFYEKSGYQVVGNQFFEVGLGHHRMEKSLLST